ncbi:MAG: acyl-CoA dehydrogenase family protein [Sphingomonadales bacterium]|nr:acyl-CoA dehydrogenase family protein [Sphingomonadales bacterium]MDE2570778.1 acyl-CoA dehydrogenase family protein [Sphingomonadales bacterium]
MGKVLQTGEQAMAVDSLRRYLAAEVEPLFSRDYRDRFMPREVMGGLMRRLAEFGLISGAVSPQTGGLGLDWLTSLMLFEEVAACSVDLSVPVLINSFGAYLLEQVASPELRERYLPGLIAGDTFVSMGISEPGVGSNVMEVRTRARRDGDHWVISGEKTWISNGAYSDFLICLCRTSDDPRGGLTQILIDRHEHGYAVRGIDKIAFNSQSTAQIFLDEVRVPVANTIGEEGGGLKRTLAHFEKSRAFVAMQAVGLARRALEEAVSYATQRSQHGKVIAGHQLIAAMLAEMATQVDAARLLVHRVAQLFDAGQGAEMEAAMAKYFACEAVVTVARQAVQIHGGNGVTSDYLVEKLAREAIVCPIPEGTTQIQQLIIARALTGVAAF